MNQEGVALLLTLLIIFTLVGLTVGFSQESSVELNLAGFARDEARATAAARAGFAFALSVLKADDPETDSLREDWGSFGKDIPLQHGPEITVTGFMRDENGKINVNTLLTKEGTIDPAGRKRIERLFALLGLGEEQLDPLLDWLDKDDVKRMEGAEDFYYQNLDIPYPCGNGPFISPGQFTLVKGFGNISLSAENPGEKLSDYLTTYSDGKININTAPKQVLQSLDQSLDQGIAENILEYRKENDFETIQDIRKVPGVTPALFNVIKDTITTKSSAFMIKMEGHCNGAVRTLTARLLRENGMFRIIYWRVS
ncbi:MAG: type II secretion system minor pseudopilin GspK [Deltaproteobacteria bacterium]|nr:type II secretion system minor pseudopilin GspK [Deltaproteobacteria bacterium]